MTPSKIAKSWLFDTNAVLAGIGDESELDWERIVVGTSSLDLLVYWCPWVITECLVTTMHRRNLGAAELARQQRAVRRFNRLCMNRVLPDHDHLIRSAILWLAGDANYYGIPDRSASQRALEHFDRLTNPAQILVDPGPPMRAILKPAEGAAFSIQAPMSFTGIAKANIAAIANQAGNPPKTSLLKVAKPFFGWFWRWYSATADRLGVDVATARRAFEVGDHKLSQTPLLAGMLEAFFYGRHVAGQASRVQENHGRDIAIAGYLGSIDALVTNDGGLSTLINEFMEGDRCVFTYAEFRRIVLDAYESSAGQQRVAADGPGGYAPGDRS